MRLAASLCLTVLMCGCHAVDRPHKRTETRSADELYVVGVDKNGGEMPTIIPATLESCLPRQCVMMTFKTLPGVYEYHVYEKRVEIPVPPFAREKP